MLQLTMLFVGALAALVSMAAVVTDDDGIAIVAGTAGTVAWAVFIYGALNVRVVTDSGVESTTMPGVAIVGLMLAVVPLFIALTGPTELVSRARDAGPDDL
jgi:hypothetical protein